MRKPEMIEAAATEFNMWLEEVAKSEEVNSVTSAALLCKAIRDQWLTFVGDLGLSMEDAEKRFNEIMCDPVMDYDDPKTVDLVKLLHIERAA